MNNSYHNIKHTVSTDNIDYHTIFKSFLIKQHITALYHNVYYSTKNQHFDGRSIVINIGHVKSIDQEYRASKIKMRTANTISHEL